MTCFTHIKETTQASIPKRYMAVDCERKPNENCFFECNYYCTTPALHKTYSHRSTSPQKLQDSSRSSIKPNITFYTLFMCLFFFFFQTYWDVYLICLEDAVTCTISFDFSIMLYSEKLTKVSYPFLSLSCDLPKARRVLGKIRSSDFPIIWSYTEIRDSLAFL